MKINLTTFLAAISLLYSFASYAEEQKEKVPVTETSQVANENPDESSAAATKVEEVEESKPEESKPAESEPEEKTSEVKLEEKVSVAPFVNSQGEINVEGISLSKNVLAEIYSPRDYKTIWFDGKMPNKDFDKAINFISLADENGLSRSYFDVGIIKRRLEEKNQEEEFIAKTDALITHMITEMILQIGNGQKIPDELKLQTYFTRPLRITNLASVFEEFMKTDDVNALIEKYSPKHPQYLLLRKNIKTYIQKAEDKRSIKPIEYSKDVVPGDKDNSVSKIRIKLGSKRIIDPNSNADVYDKFLVDKVKQYQKKFGQKETGTIDKDFIDELNKFDDEYVSRIKANMERYRWLPDKLEENRLEINLPDFQAKIFKDGKLDFTMGAIVGRDAHRTPLMHTKMYQFVLNPFWNVPKAYAIRNMVPLLRQDPNYVKNQNFDLMKLEQDGWKKIDQSSVNWEAITEDNYNYLLRQRPGNINVLGPIKFAIVNPFDIFIHSTSEPWLFTNKFRGYSSGCIRVEDPIKLAKYVIEVGGADITEDKFSELYNYYNSKDGRPMKQKPEVNDKYFKLNNPIPTYTTYFSVIANENGTVHLLDDSYNLDYNQSKLLGL